MTTLTSSHQEFTRQKALFLIALAEFHIRELARSHGAPTTAVWLIRQFNIAESTCYEYLRVGLGLRPYTLISQAFLDGTLSYSVVRLLLRYLNPDNEAELLALASSLTLRELKLALGGREPRDDKERSDYFRISVDDDTGRVRFHGELSPALGAALLSALKISELANLRDIADVDPEVLANDKALTSELAEAEDEPVTVPATDESTNEEIPATGFGVPMRDNLLAAFTAMVNMTRCRPTNKLRTPGAQINVVVTEDGHAVLPTQPATPSSELLSTVLNGEIRTHLLDSKGVHIKLGTKDRLVNDGMVTALMARWMYQCAMPGCNHTRFMEFHHIREYRFGGPTVPWNLIPLCSACHSLVSAGTVNIRIDPHNAAQVRFVFPGGASYVSTNRGLPERAGPTAPPKATDVIVKKPGDASFGDPEPDYARA